MESLTITFRYIPEEKAWYIELDDEGRKIFHKENYIESWAFESLRAALYELWLVAEDEGV